MDAGIDYGEKAVQLAPNDAATVGIISYLSGIAGAGCHSPDALVAKYKIDREDVCAKLDRSYELAKLAHKLDEGNIYSYDNYGLGNYYLLSKNWEKFRLLKFMKKFQIQVLLTAYYTTFHGARLSWNE